MSSFGSFHWYSLPAIMKKWLDEVFTHGFAHGSTAKLGDKKWQLVSMQERLLLD